MGARGTKAMIRGRSVGQKGHGRPKGSRKSMAAKRAREKRSHTQISVQRAPRISRARLRMIREDLDGTRNMMSDTVQDFWIIPERDIRETLARTKQKIGRAVEALERAA